MSRRKNFEKYFLNKVQSTATTATSATVITFGPFDYAFYEDESAKLSRKLYIIRDKPRFLLRNLQISATL